MSNTSTATRTRRRAAAGLLGMAAALTAVAGVGPVPSVFQLTGATQDVRGNCDEAQHAGDPACVGGLSVRSTEDDTTSFTSSTGSTVDDSSAVAPSADPSAAPEVRHHDDATEVEDSADDNGTDNDATEVEDSADDSSGPATTEVQGSDVEDSSGHGSDDTVAEGSSGHGSDDTAADDSSGHGSDDSSLHG